MPGLSEEMIQTLASYGPIVLMGLFFYFLFYRPQKKEQQLRVEMLNNLKKGDRVITTSGMYGTITSLDTKKVKLKVTEKIELDFLRTAVQCHQSSLKKD